MFMSPVHTPVDWSVNTSTSTIGCSSPSVTASNSSKSSDSISSLKKLCKGAEAQIAPASLDNDSEQICFASEHAGEACLDNLGVLEDRSLEEPSDTREKQFGEAIKKLEVGAGAKVKQQIHDDPNELDFWRETPEAVLVINYCVEALAKQILEEGEVDVAGSSEGFLKTVPVGN